MNHTQTILFRHFFIFCLPFLVVAGCAEHGEADLWTSEAAIVNGTPDTNPEHMAVIAHAVEGAAGWKFNCTGTLVCSKVILTAAHCAWNPTADYNRVGFTNDVQSAQKEVIQVTEVIVHPDYVPVSADGTRPPVNDLAILKLERNPTPPIHAIPWLPASLAIGPADIGATLELVGFGRTETNSYGTKLTTTTTLGWICTDPQGCDDMQIPEAPNTICFVANPGMTASGDSGGPAFLKRNGKEYVVGVTSYGDQNNTYGGCHTKIDVYDSFVRSFCSGELGDTCDSPEQCLSGFCSGNVCCDTSCQDSCKACNKTGSIGTCSVKPDAAPCPDNNRCNGEETCSAGVCQPGQALSCSTNNLCATASCDPARGCVDVPVSDQTPCPNEDVCDGDNVCVQGVCQPGIKLNCEDYNPCTEDSCDAQLGCQHSNLPDGADCGGGLCGPANCSKGVCQPVELDQCPTDQDPCTREWCDPKVGCRADPLPDGAICGDCKICQLQQCMEQEICPEIIGSGCGCSGPLSDNSNLFLLTLCLCGIWRRTKRK